MDNIPNANFQTNNIMTFKDFISNFVIQNYKEFNSVNDLVKEAYKVADRLVDEYDEFMGKDKISEFFTLCEIETRLSFIDETLFDIGKLIGREHEESEVARQISGVSNSIQDVKNEFELLRRSIDEKDKMETSYQNLMNSLCR